MKKVLCILSILISISLVGCDSREDKNVALYVEKYINTSETVTINSYNGYKLVASEIIQNEDNSYSINIKMDKPIK